MPFLSHFLTPQCSSIHDFPPQVAPHEGPKVVFLQRRCELYPLRRLASRCGRVTGGFHSLSRSSALIVHPPSCGRASVLHSPPYGGVLSSPSTFSGSLAVVPQASSLRLDASGSSLRDKSNPCRAEPTTRTFNTLRHNSFSCAASPRLVVPPMGTYLRPTAFLFAGAPPTSTVSALVLLRGLCESRQLQDHHCRKYASHSKSCTCFMFYIPKHITCHSPGPCYAMPQGGPVLLSLHPPSLLSLSLS